MNIGAYFKSANLVESGKGNVWKLVFHIRKERIDSEDLEDINALQGGGVWLIATEDRDSDYESPKEKRERDEREKYSKAMEEKRRHEANQVQLRWLDGAPDEAVLEDVFNTAFIAAERPARSYHDAAGNRQVFVSQGLGSGDGPWMSFYQDLGGSTAIHRVKSAKLPERPTREEAQADLDLYAQSKGWPVLDDASSIKPPGTITDPESRAAHGDEPEQASPGEPSAPPPDPFAKEKERLFDEGEQSESRGTRVGPPLSTYIRVGDWVALLPDVAVKLKGVIFQGGKPKPVQIANVNPEERSVQVGGRGTVFFKDLDSDWRLVLCRETINVGDVLENGMMAAQVTEMTDPELDQRWSMKERAASRRSGLSV